MLNAMRLCQALNDKICHDFAGAIGVIENSMQLIKIIDCQDRAVKLAQDATNRLMGYVQFYRYLYSSPCQDTKVSVAEISKLSTDFLKLKNRNIELVFTSAINMIINDNIAKVIICLIIAASNNLCKNAIIQVLIDIKNNKPIGIKIVISAANLNFVQDRAHILLGKGIADNVNLQNIHEYYSYYLITEYGYDLSITQLINTVEYTILLSKGS